LDTSAHIRPMSVAFDLQSHSRRRVERTIRECDSGGLGLLCPARRRAQVLPSIGLARRRGYRGALRSESRGLRSKPGLAWPRSHGRSFGSQAAAAAGHCTARALPDALAQARLDSVARPSMPRSIWEWPPSGRATRRQCHGTAALWSKAPLKHRRMQSDRTLQGTHHDGHETRPVRAKVAGHHDERNIFLESSFIT
jgi:hypothetical protein